MGLFACELISHFLYSILRILLDFIFYDSAHFIVHTHATVMYMLCRVVFCSLRSCYTALFFSLLHQSYVPLTGWVAHMMTGGF